MSFSPTDESYSREELWSQRSNASAGGKTDFLSFMGHNFIITVGKCDDALFVYVIVAVTCVRNL